MRFKDWFYSESLTSTGDIAGFSRIVLPLVRRVWTADLSDMDEDEPKKKHKKKKKKEE